MNMHKLFSIYKKIVVLILITLVVLGSWVVVRYYSEINIYEVSDFDNDIAIIDIKDEVLRKAPSYFENKSILIPTTDNKNLQGKITKVYEVGDLLKITGVIEKTAGEFRFTVENNQLTGSIFDANDIYVITQKKDETVIKKIETNDTVIIAEDLTENEEVEQNTTDSIVAADNQPITKPSIDIINSNNETNTTEPSDKIDPEVVIIKPQSNTDTKDKEDQRILKTIESAESAINTSNNGKFSITKYPEDVNKEIEKLDKKKKPNQTYVYIPELTSEKLENTNLLDIDTSVSSTETLEITVEKPNLDGREEMYFLTGKNLTSQTYLAINEDGVFGELVINNISYTIQPEGISQVHVITPTEAVDESNFIESDEVYIPLKVMESQDQPRELSEDEIAKIQSELSNTESEPIALDLTAGYSLPDLPEDEGIDVLVLYTQAAEDYLNFAGIFSYSYGNINVLNTAFANNNIKARADIVGIEEMPSSFNIDQTTPYANSIISALKNSTYAKEKRHELRADLVILISGPMNDACGIATIAGTAVMSEYGYAAVSGATGCLSTSYKSFVHELGHLMGLRHDRANTYTYTHIFEFNFGYTDKRSFASIMSYMNTCSTPCPRINYFSDPYRLFNNKPIGTENDNNTKALKYTIYDVANFLNSKNNNPIIPAEDYYENALIGYPHNVLLSPKTYSNLNYSKNINLNWIQYPYTNPDTSKSKPNAFMVWIHDSKFDYEYRELFEASDICEDVFPQNMICEIGELELPTYDEYKIIILPLDVEGKDLSWYNPTFKEIPFTISNKLPIADFHASGATEGYDELYIEFINDSQYGETYEWSIDGVVTSTSRDTFYTFSRGVHTVSLKVTNANGEDIEIKTNYINVKDPIIEGKLVGRNIEVADFRETAVYAKRNGIFEFKVEDTSTATNIASWNWDLNNDGTIESTDAIFNTGNLPAGIYSLKVTISDGEFNKDIIKTGIINVVSGEVDGIGKFNGVDTFILSGPERTDNDPLNKTYTFTGLPSNTAYNTVFTGDFDGDGMDTIGVFDPKTGEWYITNNLSGGIFEIRFNKVAPLDNAISVNMIAVAGDFDGDGKDTVGIFVKGKWYISNTLNSTDWEIVESFGVGPLADGPFKPLVGDWNRDGKDTLGYFSQSLPRIRLSNDSVENTDINSSNQLRIAHSISSSQGDLPYGGDYDGDGRDDYALRGSAGDFRVWPVGSNANNYYINFGVAGDQLIVGNW